MLIFFKKHSITISVLLLLALLVFVWLFPSAGSILGIIFLLFSFVIASFVVYKKHRKAYLQGKITRIFFMRNIFLEITGILLAMILAGLLGRFIAEIATRHISNDLIKLLAGIMIGLLVGIAVGVLIKRTSYRWMKTSSGD